ncbi:glycosyltransferase family 4 protein [Litoribacter populi]|uniref:glycosyltransferase family 4 protein n=1 Tax=Litoribacter populi TaxID=2598460 RepID=UPI00117C72B5|nr:glycosyltransferase [Litoribacter populi]
MRTFIFWQYALSIHQSAFLKNIAKSNKVILLVSKEYSENRKALGWTAPNFGEVDVRVDASSSQVESVFKNHPNAIHVFGGIDAFQFVYEAFKRAIALNSHILVYLETVNLKGLKGILRFIKYKLLFLRYERKIQGILATGLTARSCFVKIGFPENKIFDWGYFTENPEMRRDTQVMERGKPSYLYVGALIKRKNILSVLKTVEKYSEHFHKFTIVGVGPLENEIKKLSNIHSKIYFLGGVVNTEVFEQMESHDYLVLPSFFDGWGAVVNEALMSGMKVLVSEQCGASALVSQQSVGYIFNPFSEESFENAFKKSLDSGIVNIATRTSIKVWASNTISGPVVSNYFENIIEHIFDGSDEVQSAPWL